MATQRKKSIDKDLGLMVRTQSKKGINVQDEKENMLRVLDRKPRKGKPQNSSRRILSKQEEGNENINSNTQESRQNILLEHKLSPENFDEFYPWFCVTMGLEAMVIVKRRISEKYIRTKKEGRNQPTESQIEINEPSATETYEVNKPDKTATLPKPVELSTTDVQVLLIHVCYDTHDSLTELYIEHSNIVTQKHIIGLNLCLPFHMGLSKIVLVKCQLSQGILYEIGKMLLTSNISEVILDDSRCAEGNYHCLLSELTNNLKRLSLNRCDINDKVVNNLFDKLETMPMIPLQIFELSSNCITDLGARAIGNTLRINRNLVYLNLANNKISDVGAAYILNSLVQFKLTKADVIGKRQRKTNFVKMRLEMIKEDLAQQTRTETAKTHKKSSAAVLLQKKRVTLKPKLEKRSNIEYLTSIDDKLTYNKIGKFEDVFDEAHTTIDQSFDVFCLGNFKLASLSLAYNNLTDMSIDKILSVLEYQANKIQFLTMSTKTTVGTGLVRIVIEGNKISKDNDLLDKIDLCLLKKKLKTTDVPRATTRITRNANTLP